MTLLGKGNKVKLIFLMLCQGMTVVQTKTIYMFHSDTAIGGNKWDFFSHVSALLQCDSVLKKTMFISL